jgi:hypothetical protein
MKTAIQKAFVALSAFVVVAQVNAFQNTEIGEFAERDPNPYAFVLNDPANRVDPYGQWPTAIHNQIIDRALPNLKTSDRDRLKQASASVDEIAGQLPGRSYQHAMRSRAETVQEAQTDWRRFIANNMNLATEEQDKWYKACKKGYSPDALWYIGLALHAASDSTSPSHKGFQIWDPLDLGGVAKHILKESYISDADLNATSTLVNGYFRIPFKGNVRPE